jgi:hypothetical protein
MKLLYTPIKGYVHTVEAVINYAGLRDRVEPVATRPFDADTPLPSVNPIGKVPTLLLDSGEYLAGGPGDLRVPRLAAPPAAPVSRQGRAALDDVAPGVDGGRAVRHLRADHRRVVAAAGAAAQRLPAALLVEGGRDPRPDRARRAGVWPPRHRAGARHRRRAVPAPEDGAGRFRGEWVSTLRSTCSPDARRFRPGSTDSRAIPSFINP